MEFIHHRSLPGNIWAAVRAVEYSADPVPGQKGEARKKEKAAGRLLIKDIVAVKLGGEKLKIESSEAQKPSAVYNGSPVQISIAHTRSMICGAVSEKKILGIDLEPVYRKIHPLLKKRILHEDEIEAVQNISPLQLWTIKEAALKWLGSGLRTDMNTVHIISAGNPLFHITFPDGQRTAVCSFEYRSHWISIAYDHP